MSASATVSPKRRVTSAEEHELLAAADKLKTAEVEVVRARRDRDQLIAELLDANARAPDIAEILRLTLKAVHEAAARARATVG